MAEEVQLIGGEVPHPWFNCLPSILLTEDDPDARYANVLLREVLAAMSDAHRNRFHQALCEGSRVPQAQAVVQLVGAQTLRMLDRM